MQFWLPFVHYLDQARGDFGAAKIPAQCAAVPLVRDGGHGGKLEKKAWRRPAKRPRSSAPRGAGPIVASAAPAHCQASRDFALTGYCVSLPSTRWLRELESVPDPPGRLPTCRAARPTPDMPRRPADSRLAAPPSRLPTCRAAQPTPDMPRRPADSRQAAAPPPARKGLR